MDSRFTQLLYISGGFGFWFCDKGITKCNEGKTQEVGEKAAIFVVDKFSSRILINFVTSKWMVRKLKNCIITFRLARYLATVIFYSIDVLY